MGRHRVRVQVIRELIWVLCQHDNFRCRRHISKAPHYSLPDLGLRDIIENNGVEARCSADLKSFQGGRSAFDHITIFFQYQSDEFSKWDACS
jgi:hypothetical protein